jgi:putative phosphoesterase
VLIGIVSDTHLPRGKRRLPDACVELLRGCELVVHAGDFVSEEALEEIEAIGPPVAGVQGNMDSMALRRRLPERRLVEAGGARLGVVHDAGPARGRLVRMRARFPDADAVVFGHSHAPLHEESDGFQIFNPGSPTDRRRSPHHTMGLARVEAGRVRFELIDLD